MVPRSQNVRYQCANVGFLALKLPSHSGIIQAHCLSPSNYHPPSVSRCLPTGSLSPGIPLLVACLRVSVLPRHPRSIPCPPFVVSLQPNLEPPSPSHPRTSLITTTTATTSYRPGHLLENNIHKVEPHRYDRLFLLPFALPLFLPRTGFASRFLFFFVLPLLRHASEMTSPIYIYGHGFVAAETASTKKCTGDGRKTTDTSKRVVRYFTSCSFDNRARLPPTSTSRCISGMARLRLSYSFNVTLSLI